MVTQAKTWRDFIHWCETRGLKALPAHPWTISAYLRWLDQRQDAHAARAALKVISRHHLLNTALAHGHAPEHHSTVQKTLQLIERRAQTRGLVSNLFDDDVLVPPATPPPLAPVTPPAPSAAAAPRKSRHRVLASRPRLVRRRTP